MLECVHLVIDLHAERIVGRLIRHGPRVPLTNGVNGKHCIVIASRLLRGPAVDLQKVQFSSQSHGQDRTTCRSLVEKLIDSLYLDLLRLIKEREHVEHDGKACPDFLAACFASSDELQHIVTDL